MASSSRLPQIGARSARLGLAALLLLTQAACGTDPPAPGEAPAAIAYPDLRSVPPRPQLTYSLEQRREILEGLVADREHARYTDQVVRHRAGLSPLPPPPRPPEPREPAAAEPEAPPPPPAAPPPLPVREGAPDDGSLGSFLRRLEREQLGLDPDAPTLPWGDALPAASP